MVTVSVVTALLGGATLLGVSFYQHRRHDAAVSRQDAQRRQVDERARAEARAAARAAHRQGPNDPSGPGPTGGLPQGQRAPEAVSSISGAGATLVVPALGVRAPILVEDGIDGSMVIPSDIHEVGWYDGIDAGSVGSVDAGSVGAAGTGHSAPWPGQPGVAILAGHVDWAGEGPGALYYVGQLRVGDPIEVVGSNGTTTHWAVSHAPLTLSKSALPKALFTNTGPARLALVTCGGPFDAATGHYLDNVIVWASPEPGP